MVTTSDPPLLEVRRLVKEYRPRRSFFGRALAFRAVDDVSFVLRPGDVFGLVGESGSGKTTTARCVLRLIEPTAGEVLFKGQDVLALDGRGLRRARREMQMVFQDPWSSLNPRRRVGASVEEPLVIHGLGDRAARRARVEELFRLVGLDPSLARRLPNELSGGERQRVGIARALALSPSLVLADEPVSALDVTVQAQVLSLLMEVRERLNLTYVLIAHDLRLVRRLCNRVAIMNAGRIVETGPTEEVFGAPAHPYTRSLLDSARKRADIARRAMETGA